MGLTPLGLSFNVGMKDKGLAKGVAEAQKGFQGLSKSVDLVKSAGVGLAGFAMKMPRIGPMASQIQAIAEDYKITTTNVEAFGVAADKVTSAQLAGLNMSGKALAKNKSMLAGLAYGMNADVGRITEGFVALEQANVNVSKVGFKNFKEFAKFVEVTGLDTKKFAATLGKMGSQFRMSEDDIKDTLTTTIALGKRFNMGAEAAQFMSNTVSMLAEEGATMWAELGPEKTKKFMEGTQKLAIAFKNAGHTAQEAQELAIGAGRAMMKGRAGMQGLFSGLENAGEELPGVMQALTENLGGYDEAFKMLQNDPAKFAESMAKAAKKVVATAKSPQEAQMMLARFSGQMKEQFGPEFAGLIGGSLDKTIESFRAVDAAMGDLDKKGAIKTIANSYRDGLTMTERLGRAQDEFRTRLKKLMGETDGEFLKRFNVSAKVTGDKLMQISKEGGPLGKATSMMVEFSMHGLGGVASKINKEYGPAMAVLIQQFGPILSQVPSMITAFMALASPITLVAGAAAGLYFYFKQVGEGGGKFSNFVDGMANKLPGLLRSAFETISKVAPQIAKTVGKVVGKIFDSIDWNQVGIILMKGLGLAWDAALGLLKLAGRAGLWLINAFSDIDWGMVGDAIAKGFQQIVALAIDAIVYIVMRIPDILTSVAKAAYHAFVGIFDGLEKALVEAFPGAANFIINTFWLIKKAAVPIVAFLGVVLAAVAIRTAYLWAEAAKKVVVSLITVQTQGEFSAIKLAQKMVWASVTMAAQFVKDAALMIIALGPVAWAIAGVGLAVAGIIKYWDQFKSAIRGVWDTFTGFFSSTKEKTDAWSSQQATVQDQTTRTGDMAVAASSKVDLITKKIVDTLAEARKQVAELDKIRLGEFTGELGASINQLDAISQQINNIKEQDLKAATGGGPKIGDSKAEIAKLQAQYAEVVKSIKDSSKLDTDALKLHAELIRSKIKIDDTYAANQAALLGETITNVDEEFLAKAKAAERWKGFVDRAVNAELTAYTELEAKKKNLTTVEYNERRNLLRAGLDVQEQELTRAMAFEVEMLAKTNQKRAVALDDYRSMYLIHSNRILAEDKKIVAGLNDNVAKGVADKLSILRTAEAAELASLKDRNFKTVAELNKAADEIRIKYGNQIFEVEKILKSHQDLVKSTSKVDQDAVLGMVNKASEGWMKMASAAKTSSDQVTAAAVKTKKEVSSIGDSVKEFATTPQDAADLLKKMLGKTPKDFKANVDEIKGHFITMVTAANKQSQGLIDGIKKNFDSFMVQQKKLWQTDMMSVISKFSLDSQNAMASMWKALIDQSTTKAKELMNILTNTLSGVSGPMGGDISVNTASPAAARPVAQPAANLRPLDNLISHIDNPSWVGGMRYQMQEEHKDVKKLLETLIEVSLEGKSAESKRRLARFDAQPGIQNLLPGQ